MAFYAALPTILCLFGMYIIIHYHECSINMRWNFILSLLILLSPPKSSGSLWWNCGMLALWHDGNFPNDLHRTQRQKIEEATRQLISTERHCETLQMQLDSALKEMEPLKKRKQELEESQQKCKAEVEEARDRIRASEGLCQQYREVIKKFEDEEAEREANNSNEKKVSTAKLQEDLAKLKADLASEKRKNRGLERELDRAKVMIDGLQEQNSKIQQQDGTSAHVPVITPAKQTRRSHNTRTRTPKRAAPPPASAMSCSNTPSDEEEMDWSNVTKRGVMSPVMLMSPLSPLPPTPAPCRREDRFSSTSDSSADNSDMDDDADRIENELLGGTDMDVVDDDANDPPKLSPVKNNSRNRPSRPNAVKPTVNVTDEKGKTAVKWSPRDCINSSSPQKLTRERSQVPSRGGKRGRGRPPLRRAAKAKAETEEKATPPKESSKEFIENDCRSWFGEVEDLSDSESDSSPEKDQESETKVKDGAEDLVSPSRKARLCSASGSLSEEEITEEERKTRGKVEVPISPKTTKTPGATPSRYPLRSRSQDSVKQDQTDDDASSRKKNKSESDTCDRLVVKKVKSPRAQYALRSRYGSKTDKVDERIEPEDTYNKTNIVNEITDTLLEQTARKDLDEKDKKEKESVDNTKLNNSIEEEESDKVEEVKVHCEEDNKESSGLDKICSSEVENNTNSEPKISLPHMDLPDASSVKEEPSNIISAESDQEAEEQPRSDSPEFRRPLTRSQRHGGKVNPGGRRDSSSSDREGDVSPKRVTRLQTKLISPLPGPSSRTRSRSSSSEKSLSDVDAKDNIPKGGTPRRSTRKSERASLSSEKTTNTHTQKSVAKPAIPKKSPKCLGMEDTARDRKLEGGVSDKEKCTTQTNITPVLDIAPQMVTEKTVPKAELHNNSKHQMSKEEENKKSSKVCAKEIPASNTRHPINKVAVVLLEPLDKPSQRTELQRVMPSAVEQQNVGQGRELCTGEISAEKNNVTAVEQVANAGELPGQATKDGNTSHTTDQQISQEPHVQVSIDELSDQLRKEGSTKDNPIQEVPKEIELNDELPDQVKQNDNSNLVVAEEQELACDEDTMEEGELSESETEVTHGAQNRAVNAQEHQGAAEVFIREQPGVSLPERVSPHVSNRSSRSSLSTSPVSPLPPSPFESLALSPLPVSPFLLEAPISPLPPSPWGRSASPGLSPSQQVPISPLRETPLPPVVSPLQVTPRGEDGTSQSASSKDATSPTTENPHPSPCVFRSVAPKGAVQVKPKANRGRGAARSLSMNNSSKKRAILFVQSEKTAWRSGKKSTTVQDKQKSAKGNPRPTTLPVKPNNQQLKSKPGNASNSKTGEENANKTFDTPSCSQNGQEVTKEITATPEESSRQTLKQTKTERKKKGQSFPLQDKEKEKKTPGMSREKEEDPHERIKGGESNISEVLNAAEHLVVQKDVPAVSDTNKRRLDGDIEDGEITGESDDEGLEGRAVKRLKTGPTDKLTADHVLQYMSNTQGGATLTGAVNIIMEYILQSEGARVDLFPAVKTMCETGSKLPIMTTAEMAILGRVTYLAKLVKWKGLVNRVSRALSTEIRRNIRTEHLLATCRLYTGLCRLTGNLEPVRILVYDILREKLFSPVDRVLTIVSVWPLVLQRSGPALEDGPMSHVIELVLMSQDIKEDLKSCFKSLYQWKDVKDGDVNSLAERLVELLQRKESAQLLTNTAKVKYPCLNPLMYETAKALELLASHQSWHWTHDYLIQNLLLPVLQKWRETKSTPRPRSIKSTVPHGTVVAIMQVIGGIGRVGLLEDQSSVNQLQQVVIRMLTEAEKSQNSVPWGIQIAAAFSLVQLSPSNPSHTLTALQTWMKLPRPALCVLPPLLQQNVETLAMQFR
ncbi:serine/arginine repetitive matrix protein 2-like isoform X3 [Branchiostoma floridae]|uniref:Serine/arginine repetitive matrix protein 2-like isoform X3 n=1 Tax=Branchiostoma floridae TaxID=7739 RepID=A0A9J7N4U6_BRAFL|nr:serine/arginine repetitive matrix protein 2-like isoform X3 [Branchiostoma floridae]